MVGIRSGGDSVRPERTPVTASQVRIVPTEGPAIGHRTDASRLHTHASASSVPAGGPRSGDWRNSAGPAGRDRRDRVCPVATVRAAPAGLLLLCLLFRSSWLMVEGGPHGAAGVPHRRGGRAALAGSVSVAGGVPTRNSRRLAARLPSSRVDAVVSRRRPDGSSSSKARAKGQTPATRCRRRSLRPAQCAAPSVARRDLRPTKGFWRPESRPTRA